MTCRWVAPLLGLALVASPALAEEEAKEKPKTRKLTEAERKDLEKKIIGTLNSKASAIDGCVKRHLTEYPDANGKVSLAIDVDGKGKVPKASATTPLPGARNLRPCLERVAKGYDFPVPEGFVPTTLKIDVPVEKGVSFKLYAPGEAPEPKKGEKRKVTVWSFQPGAFGW